MYEQDWTPVILHKRKDLKQSEPQHQRVGKAIENIQSDDTLPPEQIDARRRKRLVALRTHLGLKMDAMARSCNIPLPDYKDMENGKLIKTTATKHMNTLFRKYKKELESMEL